MWFERKKIARFVMVLAMAVSAVSTAWAAEASYSVDVRPFKFLNIENAADTGVQLTTWGSLMKYKLFATGSSSDNSLEQNGITFLGQDVKITDTVGYVGSAKGNFVMKNTEHVIGGPLLFGGYFTTGDGKDTLLTGPVRVKKFFKTGANVLTSATGSSNAYHGKYCLDGDYGDSKEFGNGNWVNATEVSVNVANGEILSESECLSTSKVYAVDENLYIPEVDTTWPSELPSYDLPANAITYIHVPPETVGDSGGYNYFVDHIAFDNHSKLYVVMPPGGRLTKIFVENAITGIGNDDSTNVAVIHAAKMSEWDPDTKEWKLTETDKNPVLNKDYLGNLLFYTQADISMGAGHKSLQGTYMSTGMIHFSQNTSFAGQLLAHTIEIDAFFKAKDFVFVPFNPSWLDIDPTADSWGTLYEGLMDHTGVTDSVQILNAKLNKASSNDVSFKYCFVFKGDKDVQKGEPGDGFASSEDIASPSLACNMVSGYDSSTVFRTATIRKGTLSLVESGDPIEVVVNNDRLPENTERFEIYIFSLAGAILSDKSKSGYFSIPIIDDDGLLSGADGKEVDVREDEPFTFGLSDFPVYDHDLNPWDGEFAIRIVTPPRYADSLKIGGSAVDYDGVHPVYSWIIDGNNSFNWDLTYYPPKDSFGVNHFDFFEFKVVRTVGNQQLVSTDTYKLYINILPVNDPPDAHDTTFNFMENLDTKAGAVPSDVKIRIEDVDDESYTFAWSEKYDDSYTKAVLDRVKELYDLDPNTGVISAKQDAALDYESGDSVLVAKIVVSDKNGGTGDDDQIKRDIIVATIKINDVNEDPVVKPGQTFTISEFAGQDPSIPVEVVANDGRDASEPQNKVLASDVDLNKNPPKGWGYLTYTIEENPNFAIDPVTGVISVKEGADIDFEDDTKNSFTLTVTVTDGGGKSASAEVTITVSNENETPKFVDDGTDNYIALEHSKPDTVVKRWAIDDPDADDDASNLNVSLEDVHSANSVLATDVFDVRIVEESGSMFVELFVSDSAKLDFESIYEALSGDTTFAVKITLSDDEGGSSSLEKKIKVHDVNELHVAQPLNPTIDENPRMNAVVDTVKVLDPDTKNPDFRKYEYSIVEKDVPFAMSDSLIVVADSSKLDYETVPGHKFEIHVAIVDKNDPTLADTAVVVITLKDVDESPKIIPDSNDDKCDDMVTNCTKPKDPIPEDCADGHCGNVDKDNNVVAGIRENSATGTVVMEYYVVDEDGDDDDLTKLKVELKDNNKTGVDSLFGVKIVPAGADSFKVQVYVKDGSKLDYEAVKNTHNVSIIVTDTTKNGDGFNNPVALSDSIVRIIQVIDVNEPPYVVKKTFEFNEHSAADTVVGKIEWGDDNDLEGVSTEAYRDNKVEIIGGSDGYKDLFSVDSNGVIKTKKEFNFETEDPTYTLIVKVVDKNVPELFVIDTMTIKLLNIPEIPHIVNVTTSVDEHVPPKTPIDTLESRDPDCLDSAKCKYTYELVKDNPYVTVDPDGVIRVADSSKINFEEITKIDIVVRVTDEDGESSDTTITIKINDVNEPPHLKDDVCNVYENAAVNSTVCKLTAKDPDTNPKFNKLEYEQITDNDVFDVLTDGTIKLKKPLDYEKDSVYVIKVRVNDGEFSDIATITINVRDIDEKSNVEITKVIDDDSTYVRPDSVYTNSHVVQLCWHEGRTENKGSTAWGKDICEQDTLTPGRNVITKLYYDETTNYPAVDSVVIFYSNALPTVTISANGDGVSAHNIYTIVEATDKKDTNIYVNKESNDIYITVTDPSKALMGDKDSVKTIQIPTNLKPTTVDQKSYERLNYVMTAGVSVDPVSDPKKNSVSRNVNADSSVTISYVEKVAGVDVVVSYVLDKKGDVVKTPVTHSDGKVTMEEVITVSYTNKDGVTISYMAESGLKSGEVYKMDAQGNLLTSGAAEKLGKTITGNPIAGVYTVSYSQVSANGDSLKVTYSVDGKGKIISSKEGDIGYSVSYTYTDICGNSATEAVYIVLDQQPPRVGIIYPSYGEVIHSNFTNVIWGLIIGQDDATLDASKRFEVDSSWVLDKKHPSIYVRQLKTKRGEVAYDTVLVQDTLSTQGLDKGTNSIVRFYRDKAGNEAADTVYVVMKDGKEVALSVEQPVTIMSKDLVEKYYAKNPLKPGQTYAVSILNPTENKEVETLKGGNFGTKKGSGNEPYPGLDNHLGPTLKLDVRLPVISGKDGLATLDDIMSKDGKVLKYGIDADGEIKGADEDGNVPDTVKIDVDDYVQNHCTDDVIGKYKSGKETSLTLYKSTLSVKIWIYTTLGNFVDYYTFSQDLNDPDLVDEAGMLKMFFELKPDKNGEIRSEDGRVMATGAYLYKVEAKIRSDLLCDLPPLRSAAEEKKGLSSGPKKGEKPIKRSEELLKSFGYKRPANK